MTPRAHVSDALAALGITGGRTRRLTHSVNTHWAVTSAQGRFVLRRYGEARSQEDLAWEQAVLHHLLARGWSVAPRLGDVVVIDGTQYALFPYLGGRRMAGHPAVQFRRCGHVLAALHEDLSDLSLPQRPGWTAFADAPSSPLWAEAEGLLELLAPRAPAVAALAAERATEVVTGLRALRPRLATGVIHSDLVPWNVRLSGRRVSALYDFDVAHVDAIAADVACTRRGYHDGAVEAYLSRRRLSEEELDALGLLWLANVVTGALRAAAAIRDGGEPPSQFLPWVEKQLRVTLPYAGRR
jgi:Ser/Thr protein kinase RdoA (MazF antagonist)